MEYGKHSGLFAETVRKHGPWGLLLIPIVSSGIVDFLARFAGDFLISEMCIRDRAMFA